MIDCQGYQIYSSLLQHQNLRTTCKIRNLHHSSSNNRQCHIFTTCTHRASVVNRGVAINCNILLLWKKNYVFNLLKILQIDYETYKEFASKKHVSHIFFCNEICYYLHYMNFKIFFNIQKSDD